MTIFWKASILQFRQKWLYLDRMVVIGKKRLYSGKSGCIRTKWLYSGKIVVFEQDGCICAKVIVIG